MLQTLSINDHLRSSHIELPTLPYPHSLAPPPPPTKAPRAKSRGRRTVHNLSQVSKKLFSQLRLRLDERKQRSPPLPPAPPKNSYSTSPPPPYNTGARHPSHFASSSKVTLTDLRKTSTGVPKRVPLRERCNIQLSVTVKASEVDLDNDKENERFINDLNARLIQLATLRAPPRFSLLSPVAVSGPGETRQGHATLDSLHEVIPYLSVAFCESLAPVPQRKFTHVVKVIYEGDYEGSEWTAGYSHHVYDPNVNIRSLYLVVPRPGVGSESSVDGRGRTRCRSARTSRSDLPQGIRSRLTDTQLLYARDFLCLALPYYIEAHPQAALQRGFEDGETRSADAVRALICAPRECLVEDSDNDDTLRVLDEIRSAADVMSVATCYLSYASGVPVETTLQYMAEEQIVPDVWKNAIIDHSERGREESGVEFVRRVVKMD